MDASNSHSRKTEKEKAVAILKLVEDLPQQAQSVDALNIPAVAATPQNSSTSGINEVTDQFCKLAIGGPVPLANGKNAVSLVHELGQRIGIEPKWNVIGQSGPSHSPELVTDSTPAITAI